MCNDTKLSVMRKRRLKQSDWYHEANWTDLSIRFGCNKWTFGKREIGNNVDDVKKQAEAIEESRESLRALIGKASTLSSEEDIAAWGKEFSDIKNDLEEKTKTLSDTIANAPEEYQESYGKISDAATAAYDAMAGFESAVTSAVSGDVSEFKSKVSDFLGKMGDADKLWDNAEVR